MNRRIYMDNAATTRVDDAVVAEMLPCFSDSYGNAASRTHSFGWEAEEAVEVARERVAGLIGAEPREIVFTSGATESDNLALLGCAGMRSGNRHLIVSAIEHPAVADTAERLERQGVAVTRLAVDRDGRVDPDRLDRALRPETFLVSILHGNNETGVVQDLEALGAVCREHGALFHTDAAQSAGKVPIDVSRMPCDLVSLSAHKMHGPKGVGALYLRRRSPRVRLAPQMTGGGHERGLRSGTLPVPLVVGFGKACQLAAETAPRESDRIAALLARLERGLCDQIDGVVRNTPRQGRLPGILNVCFQGLEGEALLLALRTVAVSSGSACASASLEPSPVLLALGHTASVARNSLRFSLGRYNTAEEVDTVIEEVTERVQELRRIRHASFSPMESQIESAGAGGPDRDAGLGPISSSGSISRSGGSEPVYSTDAPDASPSPDDAPDAASGSGTPRGPTSPDRT